MELWRKVWQQGLAPQISTKGLIALMEALERDFPTLIQHSTTMPPPSEIFAGDPCEGACPIGYTGWQSQENCHTVAEVEAYFVRVCLACDDVFNELAAVRYWLNFWDETPREVARAALLPEVRDELLRRGVEIGSAA